MGKKIIKRKLEIVFDDKKRREYLSGFRKRKQERKRKARVELDVKVKEEKKRIKQEIKGGFREQMKKSFAPIPGLEEECEEIEDGFETEEVSVKIVELGAVGGSANPTFIGHNYPTPEINENQLNDSDEENEDDNGNKEIAGMSTNIVKKKKSANKNNPKLNKKSSAAAAATSSSNNHMEIINSLGKKINSKQNLNAALLKKSITSLKNSKAFQAKEKLNQLKDRKKARHERGRRIKLQTKIQNKKLRKTTAKNMKNGKINYKRK